MSDDLRKIFVELWSVLKIASEIGHVHIRGALAGVPGVFHAPNGLVVAKAEPQGRVETSDVIRGGESEVPFKSCFQCY